MSLAVGTVVVDTGPNVLTKTWYNRAGAASDVGTVTIGVLDGNGATVVAAGTGTTNNGDGTYSYSLGIQTALTVLVLTWTGGSQSQVDHVDVVGGHLFTEAAARAFDRSAMTSATTYPDADIAAERARITDLLEGWTGRSWIRRYVRLETKGGGTRHLWLGPGSARLSDGRSLSRPGRGLDTMSVISASLNGSALTLGNIVVDNGRLWRTDGFWTYPTTSSPVNVVVEMEYGSPGVMGVDRIGLLLLRDHLVASNISDRARSFSDELGTMQFVTPGLAHAVSNIPEVNEWVAANSATVPVF
jgi:hypothetical protein